MESIVTKEGRKGLQDDQVSRRKRKMNCVIIFFMVLFTVTIGSIILVIEEIKQETESESLLDSNPEEIKREAESVSISTSDPEDKIRVACDLTKFPSSCFEHISSIQRNMTSTNSGKMIKITPSTILMLSLRAAFNELVHLISLNKLAISKFKNPTTLSALKECDRLIRDSSRLINMSMTNMEAGLDDDEIFRTAETKRDLKEWVTNANLNMYRCTTQGLGVENILEGLGGKMLKARDYLMDCSEILAKMDDIVAKLNPTIFQRILDSNKFLFRTAVLFYFLQYFFLVLLVVVALKLYSYMM